MAGLPYRRAFVTMSRWRRGRTGAALGVTAVLCAGVTSAVGVVAVQVPAAAAARSRPSAGDVIAGYRSDWAVHCQRGQP